MKKVFAIKAIKSKGKKVVSLRELNQRMDKLIKKTDAIIQDSDNIVYRIVSDALKRKKK